MKEVCSWLPHWVDGWEIDTDFYGKAAVMVKGCSLLQTS